MPRTDCDAHLRVAPLGGERARTCQKGAVWRVCCIWPSPAPFAVSSASGACLGHTGAYPLPRTDSHRTRGELLVPLSRGESGGYTLGCTWLRRGAARALDRVSRVLRAWRIELHVLRKNRSRHKFSISLKKLSVIFWQSLYSLSIVIIDN